MGGHTTCPLRIRELSTRETILRASSNGAQRCWGVGHRAYDRYIALHYHMNHKNAWRTRDVDALTLHISTHLHAAGHAGTGFSLPGNYQMWQAPTIESKT